MKFIFKTTGHNPDPITPERLFMAISNHLKLKDVHYIYECEIHIKDTTFVSLFPDEGICFHSHPDMYHDFQEAV